MSKIYTIEGFSERVNYASKVIACGGYQSRSLDTCLEMGDGNYVATAIYRRSLKNEKIASNIWKYLDKDYFFNTTYPRTKDVKNLKQEAIKNNTCN